MRLEQQNRRSCIGLMVALVLITGLFLWAMFGGATDESMADDVKGSLGGPAAPNSQPAPPERPPPAGTGNPDGLSSRRS
jgi:hypothetical protein